jgi:sialate O-acetylesterase
MNTLIKNFRSVLSLSLVLIVHQAFGQVKLPRLVSDGMVLQQNTNVKIWGWAAAEEKVSLGFEGKSYSTAANKDGKWSVELAPLKAGGPYTMEITASNHITLKNIMVGEVWLCSGQSNMELSMASVSPIYETEIANSDNPNIRQFIVPQKYDFNKPLDDLAQGTWQTANPQSILKFSAVAYFFSKELYEKYHVPVGVINASLGGSPAESWISEGALKKFPKYYEEAQQFKDSLLIKQIEQKDETRTNAWYAKLQEDDLGYKDSHNPWYKSDINTSDWSTMQLPGYWFKGKLGPVNGVVWFRKDITVPASMVGKPVKLNMGRIVDADSVFVNGVFVGTTSYQYPQRRYVIPYNVLKEGKNTIVVRVISNIGNGGFVEDKPYELVAGNQKINLKGEWKYKLGAKMNPLEGPTFIRWKPVGLYNAMIAPLLNYTIKGVVWYQGESNTDRAAEYSDLLTTLINDWRAHWNEGNFPFLIVQLPNFMEAKKEPSESDWALLREAQLKTLSVPNTGLAVAIDLGEWNDIHPLDKKDVGKRLVLAAQKIAYGDNKVVYSGPIYKSMKIEGNKIILSFTNIGSGLVAKGGELKQFAIAGNDDHFVWAKATIEKDKVVVWSDNVPNPVAVRYAWADNPEGANLYNAEGLPASPFRTGK